MGFLIKQCPGLRLVHSGRSILQSAVNLTLTRCFTISLFSISPSFICRADDFNDAIHVERMSTLNTFTVQDLGAFSNESLSMDYTTDYYRINEWLVIDNSEI